MASPDYRLPPELWEYIFNLHVETLIESFAEPPSDLVSWCHVSRYWRNIALASPRLWRCIPLARPLLALEFLERSKPTPIFVISHGHQCQWTLVVPHAERIQGIDIRSRNSRFMSDFLSDFASVSLPILSTLSLRVDASTTYSHLIFSARTPSLCRLRLKRVAMQWHSWTSSSLTHLNLTRLSTNGTAPSISELHRMFSVCQSLEEVSLHDVSWSAPTAIPLDRVELPCLRRLHISHLQDSLPPRVEYLLAGLSVPVSATFLFVYPKTCTIHQLIPTDFSSLANLQTGEGTILRLRYQGLDLLHSSVQCNGTELENHPAFKINFLYGLPMEFLTSFCVKFDSDRFSTLEIIGLPNKSTLEWRQIFIAMPGLSTILINASFGYRLLNILAQITQTQTHSASTQEPLAICPALERLTISGSAWTLSWELHLFIFLRSRADANTPVREVVFESCQVNEGFLDKLKTLVTNVQLIDSTLILQSTLHPTDTLLLP
jgi:hypothetical protein